LAAAADVVAAGRFTAADRQRASDPAWQAWAAKMKAQAAALRVAVGEKNQLALAGAGDAMLAVCGGCHQVFPQQPTQ
jgi:cytochrome c553